jgi:serine/threonine-protein kinase
MWIWAAILIVVAVIAAVVFWLATLAPTSFAPTNMREVPDLAGIEREIALETLAELGLVPVPVEQTDDEVPADHVISTDPASGSRVTAETTIRVYISSGPEAPTVPEIARMTLEQYTAELESLGLAVGMITKQDDPNEAADRVLKVSPDPGTRIDQGHTVDVTVASGLVDEPDVTGQSIQAATAILEGLGLATSVKPNSGCAQQAGVPVVQQSIVGQQSQGSAIDIFYCSG